MWTDRTKVLVGEDGLNRLKNSSVCVVGLGGVGGYVCHILARAGVGNLTLIDFDDVNETNINRQIVADTTSIGRLKTDVLKEQIAKINPKCNVKTISERFSEENAPKLLDGKLDYVVDAIDSVANKTELICYCKRNKIKIVSAMGAGNRIGIPEFAVMDIYKTSNDGLAKVMRKNLKARGIKALRVVCCKENAIKTARNQPLGSISYYPAMCGCVLGAFVVNEILKGGKNGNS